MRKMVPQAVQQVARLMGESSHGVRGLASGLALGGHRIQPSSCSLTSSANQGA